MRHDIVFSPVALAHLDALDTYLRSVSSVLIAKNWTDSIIAHCEALDMFPHRGTRRDDLLPACG